MFDLRASRQTELEEQFPSHVVCAWLGNSEAVARKHYLQVREVDFQKAVRNPVQLASAQPRTAPQDCTANAKTLGFPRVLAKNVGDTGFDSPQHSSGQVGCRNKSGAHSGARDDADAILADDDAGLALIVEAWPMLSADVRREMLDLVERDLPAIVAPAEKSVSR